MTPKQIHSYGKIIEAMCLGLIERNPIESAPFIVTRDGRDIYVSTPYFDHCFTSDLERCAGVLCKLGVITPITDQGKVECYFTTKLAHEKIYEYAVSNFEKGPSLDEVLAAFLYYASDRGGGFRVYSSNSFPVCAEYDELFQSLACIGYVCRAGREYCWTERAHPVLKLANCSSVGDDPARHKELTGRI